MSEEVKTVTNEDVAKAQENGEYLNQPDTWEERRRKAREGRRPKVDVGIKEGTSETE